MVIERLRDHGVSRVWINGSFTTDAPRPGDVDLVCSTDGVVPSAWSDIVSPQQHAELKRRYRVDLWFGPAVKRQFESDRSGVPKGLVEISLQ